MSALVSWFQPSGKYDGVRPFHVFMLRLFYFLAAAFVATWAWRALLTHEGPWEQYQSVMICVWAAYPTLMAIGLIHPVRMLPIMLFTVFYKALWLGIVAYPMYQAGTLTPSALQMAKDFALLPIAIIAVPWGYAFRTYLLRRSREVGALGLASAERALSAQL
jgi:hypothetical protein